MATRPTSTAQGTPQPGARGHEKRDASPGWIFGIVFFIMFCGLIIHLALAGLFTQFKNQSPPRDAYVTRPPTVGIPKPSFPQLQVSPRLDLSAFRAREDEELTNYGWIDRTSGVVRIPIDRAMELVLQKGLPVRTNSQDVSGASPAEFIQQRSANRRLQTESNQ